MDSRFRPYWEGETEGGEKKKIYAIIGDIDLVEEESEESES